MQSKLILVAGKNPLGEIGGGHTAYVCMWAHAATHAGYRPEIFAISRDSAVIDSSFGKVHTLRSPLFWLFDKHKKGFGTDTAIFHVNLLKRKIVDFVLQDPSSFYIIHGIGPCWGAVAIQAAISIRKSGIKCKTVTTVYTTLRHENKSIWKNLTNKHGFKALFRYGWQMFTLYIFLNRYEKSGYLKSDLVLLNYDSVRRIIEEQWGLHPDIRKVPYSTVAEFLPAKSSSEETIPEIISNLQNQEKPLLMTVSRHDPRKGLDTFINALALLKDKGIRFRACLVGAGPLLEPHRKLAKSLNIQDEVAFTGFVDDVMQYIKQADVFVLPSYEEASGSVSMLEAMQCSKAIVASGLDGIPEDVTDRESALLVPPRNIQALTERLEELIYNPELRDRLGSTANSVFRERFSRDVVIQAVRKVYDNIA